MLAGIKVEFYVSFSQCFYTFLLSFLLLKEEEEKKKGWKKRGTLKETLF